MRRSSVPHAVSPVPRAASPVPRVRTAPPLVPTPVTPSGGPSWVPLMRDEAVDVERLERFLSEGLYAEVLAMAEELASRLLVEIAADAGLPRSQREPALSARWLGIETSRWIAFRQATRRAREGQAVSLRHALLGYALVLEIAARRGASEL